MDAQHLIAHNALHTHQVGVMNRLIHLTHNEEPNQESSSAQQIKEPKSQSEGRRREK